MALTHFDGAVVVITGGASGIGFATAQEAYTRGAKVVLADIHARNLHQAVEKIRQQKPDITDNILGIPTDVTDYEQIQALMQQAVTTYGRIDLVVTCAGIGNGGTIDTFTVEDMRAMIDINFMGIFHCVKAAIPTMRQQQNGYFVFLSSVAGKLGSPTLSGYCASKWAVRGFATSLRVELYGSGIGITTVYPSFVDTPMYQREMANTPFLAAAADSLLKPEQVAHEILQAVTEEKRDLTLAPNPDVAKALLLMKEDPDNAEILMGKAYRRQLEHMASPM